MIDFKQSSHWYNCHGDKPLPKHDYTLREARKDNSYPSITSIDKEEFRNVGLERYALGQMAEAASENFRMPHESSEDYQNRIYRISLEHRDKAGKFGTDLHDAIEHYPQYPLDPTLHPWLDKFAPWYDKHVAYPLYQERILFDHNLGIAGRCDMIAMGKGPFEGKVIIPDWKSQDVKKTKTGKKTPQFYPSWARQLAFYSISYAKEEMVYPLDIPICLSIVIDSNEPDDPFMRVWEDNEVKSAYEDVIIASYRYCKSRNFWPQRQGKINLAEALMEHEGQ